MPLIDLDERKDFNCWGGSRCFSLDATAEKMKKSMDAGACGIKEASMSSTKAERIADWTENYQGKCRCETRSGR